LLAERAKAARNHDCEHSRELVRAFIAACRTAPIAVAAARANEQHYELPAEFFRQVLGNRLKYSCCLWSPGVSSLDVAEEAALAITGERARLENGQAVLDLGCGWGSFSLYAAAKYPHSQITAVSNSESQGAWVRQQAAAQGLRNIEVLTADINTFAPERRFDRIVSIEMFEHLRNHRELMRRIAQWLTPDGLLFVHIFCHRSMPYLFEERGPSDWMTRYFFAGGMMPSDSLLLHYQADLSLRDQWRWNGIHYQRTCEAWLQQCDRHREPVLASLTTVPGISDGSLWLQRWRIFFMACAELFGYRDGQECWVSHYLFGKD
jgi:cyclopropane-fatty-acyl-phospholipid synthase